MIPHSISHQDTCGMAVVVDNTEQRHAVGASVSATPPPTTGLRRRLFVTNFVSFCVCVLTMLLAWRTGIVGPDILGPPMDSTLPSRRSLQDGTCGPDCECPTLPPSQNVDGDCNAEGIDRFFTSYTIVEFEGRPRDRTAAEIATLESSFRTTYNALGAPLCREIIDVEIEESVFDTRRRLQFGLGGRNRTAVTRPLGFLYKVTWQCNFCGANSRLFGNDATRRQLQAVIPPGFSVEDGGPDLESFLSNYDATIAVLYSTGELDSIDRVIRVTELEEQEGCEEEATIMSTNVDIGFEGEVLDLSVGEVALLEDAFVQTYNQLNALNIETCDPLFREVGLVSGDQVGDDHMSFEITFRCRGCEFGDGIFSESSGGGRDLGLLKGQDDRSMQTVDSDCICDPRAVELRAPTLAEFQTLFNDAIQVLIVQNDVDFGGAVNDVSTITTDKASYFQGETALVTYMSTSVDQEVRFVQFYPVDEVDFSMPSLGGVPYLTNPSGLSSARIIFPETGLFKVVVRGIASDRVLAIGDPFEVLPSIATLTTDKGSYNRGEEATIVFSNPDQLGPNDGLAIIPANGGTGVAPPVFDFLNERGSDSVFISDDLEPGSYRFVLSIYGTVSEVILAMSDPFEVVAFP